MISQEDLGLLLSYTQKKAEQMMQQMAEGEIAVTPLKTGNHTSCDFVNTGKSAGWMKE